MASLQIRDVPEPLHQQVLQRIRERWEGIPPVHWQVTPEELIRADRER